MFFTIGKSRRATNEQLRHEADMVLELVSTQENSSPALYNLQTMVHQRFREIEARKPARRVSLFGSGKASGGAAVKASTPSRPLGVQGNIAAGKMAFRAIFVAIVAVAAVLVLGTILVSALSSL